MDPAPEPAPRPRRWPRRLVVAGGLLLVAFLLRGPVLRAVPGWLEERGTPGPADALIVLAGDSSGGRVDRAVELFLAGHVAQGPFVCSGGELYPGTSWAELMRARAVARGVPAERCVEQGRSRTTVEDAELTVPLLPAGTRRVLLVTSDFHSARAAADFRRVLGPDVEVVSLPSESPWDRDAWWQDPVAARAIATECLKRLW
ncbi:MAG: YdcF family protein [Planctomycetota bacterium]